MPGRGQSRTLIVKKEVMTPCTYVGLALGEAPSGHICFGSLEFVNIDGPVPLIVLSLAKLCDSGT
jgi:hypothetical protein